MVAISGDETGETVRRAYEAGVSDYINRPFDARVVYRRVKNTVKVYSEQKRLISSVTREMREKEEATNVLISLFGELVEFRNDFGGNHVKNVGKITELLLERLVTKTQKYNLSERDIFLISTASALHDVGKFAVKEEIVNKPAKLTDAEFEEMKNTRFTARRSYRARKISVIVGLWNTLTKYAAGITKDTTAKVTRTDFRGKKFLYPHR